MLVKRFSCRVAAVLATMVTASYSSEAIGESILQDDILMGSIPGYPILVMQEESIFGGQHAGCIDLLFADSNEERNYLLVETKYLDQKASGATIRTRRRKHRKFVKEQAQRYAPQVANLYGRPTLAAYATNEMNGQIEKLSLFHPQRAGPFMRCEKHDRAMTTSSSCSANNPCQEHHCSRQYPCKKSLHVCLDGCFETSDQLAQRLPQLVQYIEQVASSEEFL